MPLSRQGLKEILIVMYHLITLWFDSPQFAAFARV